MKLMFAEEQMPDNLGVEDLFGEGGVALYHTMKWLFLLNFFRSLRLFFAGITLYRERSPLLMDKN